MKSTEFPLEAAVEDVVFRYKKGSDMLASCAAALRRLKERIDAGEAGPDWDWPRYRAIHLEQHISRRWINVQLKLAPPGATDSEVAENAEQHRQHNRDTNKRWRASRDTRDATQSPDPHPGIAVSAEGESSPLPHAPALIATPHDDREGGDSVVTPDDGLQEHYHDYYYDVVAAHERLALADSSVTADRADGETPRAVETIQQIVIEIAGRVDGSTVWQWDAFGAEMHLGGGTTPALIECIDAARDYVLATAAASSNDAT
jgi:hypothetical protein